MRIYRCGSGGGGIQTPGPPPLDHEVGFLTMGLIWGYFLRVDLSWVPPFKNPASTSDVSLCMYTLIVMKFEIPVNRLVDYPVQFLGDHSDNLIILQKR